MSLPQRSPRRLPACVLLAAAVLTCPTGGRADQKDPAAVLPADTIVYVVIPDVSGSRERFKKTSFWSLYKDPAMQRFIAPAEKAIREKIDESLREAWKDLGMEDPPKDLPWPTGRVMFALRLGMTVRRFPIYDWQAEGPPKIKGFREVKMPAPQMVVSAEMGENMAALKRIVDKATEKAVEQGFRRRREAVRGGEMVIFTPPPPKRPEGMPPNVPFAPPEQNPYCYAIRGSTILAANSIELLKGVLARTAGAEIESLADNAGMKTVLRGLGGPGDLTAYLNVEAMVKFGLSSAPAEQKEKARKTIRALGADNLVGLGVVARLAPSDREDLRLTALLGVRGEKRGIPAAIADASADPASPLLTSGLTGVLVANYDLARLYDRIRQMVLAVDGTDINEFIGTVMAPTGGEGAAGPPPVDLRKDVLAHITSPLVGTLRLTKPYTSPSSPQLLLAAAVRNPPALNAALGRIHDAFIARGRKDLRRELLGSTIYLLPGAGPLGALMGGAPQGQANATAVAVAGNQLVFSSTTGVEQAIRNLRRKDIKPIAADPMYRYAARYLPAGAAVWSYQNHRPAVEMLWAKLKQAARSRAAADRPARRPTDTLPPPGAVLPTAQLDQLIRLAGLGKSVDFAALPDFQAVRKYFGAAVAYLKGTDQGIRFEIIYLKAPPEK